MYRGWPGRWGSELGSQVEIVSVGRGKRLSLTSALSVVLCPGVGQGLVWPRKARNPDFCVEAYFRNVGNYFETCKYQLSQKAKQGDCGLTEPHPPVCCLYLGKHESSGKHGLEHVLTPRGDLLIVPE